MILLIVILVLFSACSGMELPQNKGDSSIIEEDRVAVVKGFLIKQNEETYRHNLVVDSAYIKTIPKFDDWRFLYVGRHETANAEQRYDFDVYVGDNPIYHLPNVRRYLVYTGVLVKQDSIIGIQTSNGENHYFIEF